MRAIGIFAAVAAASIAHSQSCVAEIPMHGVHHKNIDYQFSVQIPDHLLGCVSEDTNNGVEIPLDRYAGCDAVTDRPPFATVFANYNVATGVKTAKGLAKLYCRDPKVRRTMWLDDWALGGRAAAGCRLYFGRDRIEVKLMTLRKTEPDNPEIWIEIGAYLSTTVSRYERDMRVFRQIVRTVRIAPDGPLK